MIPPSFVRADVIDIRDSSKAVPSSFLLDANVLYFLYYPNFDDLARAGGTPPRRYQIADYPNWHRRTLTAKAQPLVAPLTLGEFAKLFEHAEFEALWLTHPNPIQPDPAKPDAAFSPRVCKACRYAYPNDLARIRQQAWTFTDQILKSVRIAAALPSSGADQQQSFDNWQSSAGDYPDANMVAIAKHVGVTAIVSDDADLISFAGICVCTANQRAIDAAKAASRLR